jgi:hypothetical protein
MSLPISSLSKTKFLMEKTRRRGTFSAEQDYCFNAEIPSHRLPKRCSHFPLILITLWHSSAIIIKHFNDFPSSSHPPPQSHLVYERFSENLNPGKSRLVLECASRRAEMSDKNFVLLRSRNPFFLGFVFRGCALPECLGWLLRGLFSELKSQFYASEKFLIQFLLLPRTTLCSPKSSKWTQSTAQSDNCKRI